MALGRVPRSVGGQFAGFDSPVYVVAIGQFVNVFGGGMVYPFAALYFVETVGLPFRWSASGSSRTAWPGLPGRPSAATGPTGSAGSRSWS